MTDVLTPPASVRAEPAQPPVTPPAGPPAPSRLRRLWRGPETDPAWARPALFVLLAATGVLYLWHLGDDGWANSYYSAAVQAGSQSWKAFFFGSLDAANFITVDKPPASLWVMDLSARVFGVNSWSILVPQALRGRHRRGALHDGAAVVLPGRRPARGAVLAAHAGGRADVPLQQPRRAAGAVAGGRRVRRRPVRSRTAARGWLVLAGSLVGFGFLAKMLQALVVCPASALVYLLAGPPRLRRRIWQLALGRGRARRVGRLVGRDRRAVAGVGRPVHRRLAGQQLLNLIFGYNGFGRLTGDETGSVGGGAGGHRRPAGARPAGPACSTPSSAARRRG